MVARRRLGRRFGWLWAAYAVSTFGTRLAFDAFALIAILVLHAGPAEVSVLAATGLAVGAVVAVPLGPWVEFHRKRPVMIAMDLTRFVALMSVPAAYALGLLGFVQLLVVSVVVGAADIAFNAAGGAYLKAIVRPEDLVVASGRFESTNWTATVLGPPVGTAAIGFFGPVLTVVTDAVSYLLSAAGIRAIGGQEPHPVHAGTKVTGGSEPHPARTGTSVTGGSEPCPARAGTDAVGGSEAHPVRARTKEVRLRFGGLFEGWRYILAHPALRPLFLNTVLVSGLIMATSPLLAVLMLADLGFAPWQYGLAFGLPCVGGIIGSRLAPRLVARFGRHRVMLTAGTLRACWSLGPAFVRPGVAGLVLVIVVEFGLITCMGVFNPVFAAYRLDRTATDRVARTLSAWSVTSKATVAVMTGLWGLLAGITGPRVAIAAAGLLMLVTPFLLPRHDHTPHHERDLARSPT
ncbi:MFS transporter [Streptomyces sp. ID05-39B]|uniref:MFS transporter n=1 Tax=Streptomyces sp. ID05-39B TaxID=3028664 RepID=UPI0029B0D200|nr:MFS transporter [Streptomyces sp. ID05-39B]MDX3530699.1 MFS transporter [Streptomyces sp. ID05-39B]